MTRAKKPTARERVVSAAAKVFLDPKSSRWQKSMAASAVTQTKEAKVSKTDQIAALRARRHDLAAAARVMADPKASKEVPSAKASVLRQRGAKKAPAKGRKG